MALPEPKGTDSVEDAKWGGPPGPQPTPTSASWKCDRAPKSGSRGTRADQGVRPTWLFINFGEPQAHGNSVEDVRGDVRSDAETSLGAAD